jgi:5-methylcytosine-specific restriction endonuclease McrA
MQDEPPLRTADQVELAMRRIAELQRQAAEERTAAIELVKSARLSDEEKAEIYWRFDVIPVSAMGIPQMITPIAARYPYWSWRCLVCGTEVFCTSRSDKADRERRARDKRKQDVSYWTCRDCVSARNAGWAERAAQAAEERQRRERLLRTMPYREYLQTPEWAERRLAAYKRAKFACQVCNAKGQLQAHHRTYERRGRELASDLIVLCDRCHALYHGKGLLPDHED